MRASNEDGVYTNHVLKMNPHQMNQLKNFFFLSEQEELQEKQNNQLKSTTPKKKNSVTLEKLQNSNAEVRVDIKVVFSIGMDNVL